MSRQSELARLRRHADAERQAAADATARAEALLGATARCADLARETQLLKSAAAVNTRAEADEARDRAAVTHSLLTVTREAEALRRDLILARSTLVERDGEQIGRAHV